MKKLLTSGWLIPIVGALLYLGTTFVLLDPQALKFPTAAPVAAPEPDQEASPLPARNGILARRKWTG